MAVKYNRNEIVRPASVAMPETHHQCALDIVKQNTDVKVMPTMTGALRVAIHDLFSDKLKK